MQDEIWVKSKKGKAVHLIDRTVVKEGNYQRVDISIKMAEAGIPVKVQKSDFILSYCSGSDAILEIILDNKEAEELYKNYFGVASEAEKLKREEEEKQKKIQEAALKAALDSYEKAQQRELEESRPSRKARVKKGKANTNS